MTSDSKGPDYVRRFYRDHISAEDLVCFRVAVGESDLLVGVSAGSPRDESGGTPVSSTLKDSVVNELLRVRRELRAYIRRHPRFGSSLHPVDPAENAPPIACQMAEAAAQAEVGPMAAVAGAIAQAIGLFLAGRFEDVVVENGGDVFLHSSRSRTIGIYSGENSKLSDRLAIRLGSDRFPLGVCTSAGTVGPSLSFGSADAVTVLSKNTALADAVATSVGNRVASPSDIQGAIRYGSAIPGIEGIIVVKGDRFGTWGRVEFV